MQIPRIAVIGAGNMGRALVGGLIASGAERSHVTVADPQPAALDAVGRQFSVAVTSDNGAAAERAQVVVIAVKPQDMRAVVTALEPRIHAHHPLVVSVAAGIPLAAISRWLNGHQRIVRTMPNRPALLGCGVTALFAPGSVSEADRALAGNLLSTVGAVVWLTSESQLDAVTAVSGSGPAYFFLLIELLEAAAREQGLPADVARSLSIETAYGAGCLARQREHAPDELRAQVTSRGGTTEAALREFELADLRGIVSRAVAAATRRSAELAGQFGS
jgi:pyrroline-5-carboxylate reductase